MSVLDEAVLGVKMENMFVGAWVFVVSVPPYYSLNYTRFKYGVSTNEMQVVCWVKPHERPVKIVCRLLGSM